MRAQTANSPSHPHSRKQPCSLCLSHHPPTRKPHRCYILCAYCHSMHLKRDLVCGRCPKMESLAQLQQQKSALSCPDCKGEGNYQKIVQTTISETRDHYERRLKSWLEQELKGGRQVEDIRPGEWPLRRILKQGSEKEEVHCKRCEGRGKIQRLVTCCESQNCKECNSDGYVVNPEWMKLRMEGVEQLQGEEAVQCSICLSSVEEGEKKLTLDCGHLFHPACILKWLLIQEKCPVCRQTDPFLDTARLQAALRPARPQLPGHIHHRNDHLVVRREMEQAQNLWRMGMEMVMEREVAYEREGRRRQAESVMSESEREEEWVSDHSFSMTDNFMVHPSFHEEMQDEEDW